MKKYFQTAAAVILICTIHTSCIGEEASGLLSSGNASSTNLTKFGVTLTVRMPELKEKKITSRPANISCPGGSKPGCTGQFGKNSYVKLDFPRVIRAKSNSLYQTREFVRYSCRTGNGNPVYGRIGDTVADLMMTDNKICSAEYKSPVHQKILRNTLEIRELGVFSNGMSGSTTTSRPSNINCSFGNTQCHDEFVRDQKEIQVNFNQQLYRFGIRYSFKYHICNVIDGEIVSRGEQHLPKVPLRDDTHCTARYVGQNERLGNRNVLFTGSVEGGSVPANLRLINSGSSTGIACDLAKGSTGCDSNFREDSVQVFNIAQTFQSGQSKFKFKGLTCTGDRAVVQKSAAVEKSLSLFMNQNYKCHATYSKVEESGSDDDSGTNNPGSSAYILRLGANQGSLGQNYMFTMPQTNAICNVSNTHTGRCQATLSRLKSYRLFAPASIGTTANPRPLKRAYCRSSTGQSYSRIQFNGHKHWFIQLPVGATTRANSVMTCRAEY